MYTPADPVATTLLIAMLATVVMTPAAGTPTECHHIGMEKLSLNCPLFSHPERIRVLSELVRFTHVRAKDGSDDLRSITEFDYGSSDHWGRLGEKGFKMEHDELDR